MVDNTESGDAGPAVTKFVDIGLPEALLHATQALGFDDCTRIQALSLPHIIAGDDVAAQAQTGTGKTAAYLLGAFARLSEFPPSPQRAVNQPRVLVIAPTRELAIQIRNDAEALAGKSDIAIRLVYGGVDYEKQARQVSEGVDVLIGTPGRLIDYFKQKVFNLAALEIVVLDEADRMFDLGFIADIRYLLRRMPDPENRLSMLFSATLSNRVMELAYEHMDNPVMLKTEAANVTADGVEQQLYHPATEEKPALLIGLIRHLEPQRSIVFVNTKRTAEDIEAALIGNGLDCGTLSGDVRQSKRQRILQDFTNGNLALLIATDVAARGLHIDDVTHVFNYDLPQQAEDYVHRIGRTARAGATGVAISFACEKYAFSLPDIEAYIEEPIPTVAIVDELVPELAPSAPVKRANRTGPGRSKGGDGSRGRGRSGSGSRSDSRSPRSSRSGSNRTGTRRSENASETADAPSTAAASPNPDDAGNAVDATTNKPKRRRRRRPRRKSAETSSATSPAADSNNTDG